MKSGVNQNSWDIFSGKQFACPDPEAAYDIVLDSIKVHSAIQVEILWILLIQCRGLEVEEANF